MLEVEVRYRVADFEAVRHRLAEWGVGEAEEMWEADLYFNAPHKDFRTTDEALRLRRTGSSNRLTYKGPRRPGLTKTRPEIEVPLGAGDQAATLAEQFLLALGFRPVATVRKHRWIHRLHRHGFPMAICLDEVDKVGTFVELEILAEETQYDAAQAALLHTAAELNLHDKELRSYLQMVLEAEQGRSMSTRDTVHSIEPVNSGTQAQPPVDVVSSETPVVETIEAVRAAVAAARQAGKSIGFVPTMGALHAGHAALIRAARAECGFVVVSIFVNPTQFGPNEDYSRYPRTLTADRRLCAEVGADLIFAPSVSEMYPAPYRTYVEVKELDEVLCGVSRPGHFRGVCTVVLKLFHIVQPDVAYFGEKDYQQARIVAQMVRDLNVPVQLRTVATVREADGLALSSRNVYLTPAQRQVAPRIYQALLRLRERVATGESDVARLEADLRAELAAIPEARVDYARIVDADTLQPLTTVDSPAVAAVAVFLGATRLIDNIRLK
ncbi:MAG: pantoate--beta-alanine ligase [Thermogemmata sp.]|nr:pantoate--beta-alanine ligase [Thermogemmata sp.]